MTTKQIFRRIADDECCHKKSFSAKNNPISFLFSYVLLESEQCWMLINTPLQPDDFSLHLTLMAMFQNTNYNVRMFGQKVTVPDVDVAKVMYYLDCVCTVVDYDDNDIQRYRDYSNWSNMSDEGDKLIFVLAATLSPDELEDKVFFESAVLCRTTSNQFYEIGQVRNQLLVDPSIVIGGQSRQVKKIMAYTSGWMQRNYYQPMQALAHRFSPQGQREEARRRTQATRICIIS